MDSIETSDIVARVSHELRTPLTSIIGYAEVMMKGSDLAPDQEREFATIIRDEGKRLADLIDVCLDLAFQQSMLLSLPIAEGSVDGVIQEAIKCVSKQAKDKELLVISHLPKEYFVSKVDPARLLQVFYTILLNAISVADNTARIEISTHPLPSGYGITFTLAQESLDDVKITKLLNHFAWSHAPGLGESSNGLGLAFARHVIELYGGRLEVIKEEKGIVQFHLEVP
ncbi:MAG: HAMP domain-containing sensor histidine kinase [bacterium]